MNPLHWPFPLALSGISRLLRRLARATEGVESIEFALVSIPLFLFLFGIVEFGRLYWTQSELQYAAEAAARYVTINPTAATDTVQSYTVSKVYGTSVASGITNFHITSEPCGNQITFNYTFNFIVGPLLPEHALTLSAKACHQA